MPDVASLTFVTRLGNGRLDLWTPERTEDYAAACALGRDYATEMLAFMQATSDVSLFGAVIRAMTMRGAYGGVEAGFCSVIGIQMIGIDAPVTIAVPVVPVADAA